MFTSKQIFSFLYNYLQIIIPPVVEVNQGFRCNSVQYKSTFLEANEVFCNFDGHRRVNELQRRRVLTFADNQRATTVNRVPLTNSP